MHINKVMNEKVENDAKGNLLPVSTGIFVVFMSLVVLLELKQTLFSIQHCT